MVSLKSTVGKVGLPLFLFVLAMVGSCRERSPYSYSADPNVETVALLETTEGSITLGFFPDKAPNHVENFLELCGSGFYDGTYFHRVSPQFLVQGGDPLTLDDDPSNDGTGGYTFEGPGTSLQAEFNDLSHRRGMVSMARGSDRDSAGSQFFIVLADAPEYDGQFTAFAEVVEGLETVDAISLAPGTEIPGVGGVNPEEHQHIIHCEVIHRSVGP